MSLFLRKIKQSLYVKLMSFAVSFQPGARHFAFTGSGSSAQLCLHIARMGFKKVLVVTDKPLRELGVVDRAVAALVDTGVDVAYYDGVLPDPTYGQVAEGAAAVRSHGSEAVLAIGGGSSMDAAKIIAACAKTDESPTAWVGFGKVKHEVLPLFAIPTTSGTGSEATMGAVISDSDTHEKSIISGAPLIPAATALDPDLITGLPPHITAATGMDALTHGIEAYIGIWERGTRLEDSRAAVKLVFDNLATAYRDGSNLEARAGMAMGSYYAGIAINQVNVGSVHAIAHQLGAKYGIPHGLANALVLPHILDYCREEAQQRLSELATVVGLGAPGDSAEQLAYKFIQGVRDLRTEVGIPDHSEKIRPEDYEAICAAAIAEGDGYPAPRLLEHDTTIAILRQITA
ncbi:MAG: iron-containing alcohol dehydrogenase [Halioglobus sp.]